MQMQDRYEPSEIEPRIYNWWSDGGYFKASDVSTKPPYSIIMPPPNVTGALHLGHALDHTIQDCLIRWKRMSGYNALWIPGTDHAGIATQSVVERELKKENVTRKDLGREKFEARVWEWKETYGNRIVEQCKKLGDSCDWDRLVFTLDEGVSRAVRKVFVQLYKKNWIYKGTKLINWSPALESAISDLEVEHKEIKGTLFSIKYPVVGSDGRFVIVATTRPETLLGDVAVAVHPDDERYKDLIGKQLALPLTGRQIPVIADAHVSMEFGTGAVKITPAHDFNDYEMGVRHKLEMINILNKNGTLNERAGVYQGLHVQEARKRVLADLGKHELLDKEEPHIHSVGHCSRTGVVVEPLLSTQWFVKTKELCVPAKRAVESGTTTFYPDNWTKTYLHWLNIIEDWCISRQLWWGHRIPAWNCSSCQKITVSEADPVRCEQCGGTDIQQDEDVLDTWFSSALWPFSTMGWPEQNETQKTFYPTSVLVTGHDIIFFWVARMMMMGLEFTKDVPFRSVYIHGLIRDAQGRKMSKSLNNSIDPLDLISQFGADALRFTLLAQLSPGRDLKFSTQRLEGYRNFMNKIWNASKFALGVIGETTVSAEQPKRENLSDFDIWIITKAKKTTEVVDRHLKDNRFAEAGQEIYQFFWNDFCDWYIELIKPTVYGPDSANKEATKWVLIEVLNCALRLLHPFCPYITEEIYQKLPNKGSACIVDQYPTLKTDKAIFDFSSDKVVTEIDLVKDVITAIRNIRGENQIKPGVMINVVLDPKEDVAQKILLSHKPIIQSLGKITDCKIGHPESVKNCAVTPVFSSDNHVEVVIPLEGLVDLAEELKRIEKNIEKISKELVGLKGRMENQEFVKNAPEEVVIQGREKLVELTKNLEVLSQAKTRLS
jgi:valyl-tRNA synthetase